MYDCERYFFISRHFSRRHAPLPPKCKHCCNPYQYCGGTIKLAFAAKSGVLAVKLAVRMPKKAAAKDMLIFRRARQTRKQACSLSRASPYQIRKGFDLSCASTHGQNLFSFGTAHAIRAKKTPSPRLYVRKNSACSGPPGARTLDTLIKSQVLYQLS